MRIVVFTITLFLTLCTNAQTTYNKWSFDGNLGFSNAVGPFAPGYTSNFLVFAHLDGGARYMLTDKFGVKWDFGFDRIKNDEAGGIVGSGDVDLATPSLEFETHYFRTNLQAVFNLGRMAEFENIHPRLGCLLHFGFGFASLKDKNNSVWFKPWKTQGTDEMMNVMIGLTPQYYVHSKLAFHADISVVANGWQSRTWDMTEKNFVKGLHGKLMNFSVGMSYYFGKADRHLDWVLKEGGVQRKDSLILIETIRKVETVNVDEDQVEPKKDDLKDDPEDDFDGDGIPNSQDRCPTQYGDTPTGCPSADRDNDGVRNDIDDCPDIPGIKENGGCPGVPLTQKVILNQAQTGVKFVNNKPELKEGAEEYLDQVVTILEENPNYFMELRGHTDNLGEKEPLKALSLARAETVKAYMVDHGISEDRVWCLGLGDTLPIAPNDNPQGREQNRRVEFKVQFKKPE